MRRLPALVVTLVVVALVTTVTAAGAIAWADQDDASQVRMGPGMMAPASGSAPGRWDDSWGSNMMGVMGSVGVAGEPEYLAEMIAHHQEAVAAGGELARSDRSDMRAFGASIVTTQSAQIEQMQAWLDEWYPERSTSRDYRPMMRDLSGLFGDQLDETFLQDMIGHHMAAVMMSQQLLRRGTDHEQVARLARTIRDDQHTEIVQMRRWLTQWFDADRRGGTGCGAWSGQAWGTGPGMMRGPGR